MYWLINYLLKIILLFFIFYQILVVFIGLWKDITKYKIKLNDFLQRFSFYNKDIDNRQILIHAVSCGEANTSKPIIKSIELKKKSYLLSIHTPTGYNLSKKFTNNSILKPFDTLPTIFYLFYRVKPKILLIMESDVWFFYILLAKIFRCKIYFFNYLIKPKKKVRNYLHYLIADKIYVKTKKDVINMKYHYLGNLKLLSTSIVQSNKKLSETTIIISSAGKDEIDLHLTYIKNLLQIYQNIKIIYVTRHLNWKNLLLKKISHLDYFWCENNEKNIDQIPNKLIVCWCYGMLNYLYSKSHICLMGDTFNNVGGHNLIEPAINQNVVIVGPNYHTCSDLANIIQTIYVKNESDLISKTKKIIDNNSFIQIGKMNKNIVLKNQTEINVKLNKIITDLN
jgi:3-deoxy-D-manno-octulosonic-acid transferase